jgi:UDP:flavonoid glycosyltransferase YjiC (YdhE family)
MGFNVAVLPIPAVGHANPILAVVEELAAHPEVARVRGFGAGDLLGPFAAAGADFVTIGPRGAGGTAADGPAGAAGTAGGPPGPGTSELAHKSFVRPTATIDETMRQVGRFAPDVILYDVFCLPGLLAGRHLGVPAASFITFPGYGALGAGFAAAHPARSPSLAEADAYYRERFGVGPLAEGFLPVLFPARELSLVSCPRELSRPEPVEPVLPPIVGPSVFVGPCTGTVRMPMSAETAPGPKGGAGAGDRAAGGRLAPFPFERVVEARRAGRKVVLFSLGTVLTDFRFGSPVGGARSGRDFLRRLLRHLVRAFSGDGAPLVVVATGALLPDHDMPPWPDNFVVRAFVPQRELLDGHVDAFVTHCGMNSMTESILAGVPMVVLPGVGDQVTNADTVVRRGAGVALWDLDDPHGTCTAGRLRQAVERVLYEPGPAKVCRELGALMRRSGGAALAARLLVRLAAGHTGRDIAESGEDRWTSASSDR